MLKAHNRNGDFHLSFYWLLLMLKTDNRNEDISVDEFIIDYN
jgi:hypothetical protein